MKILKYSFFILILSSWACTDYLDIVPEKTQELDLIFKRKTEAYKALATCYSYLPNNDDLYGTSVLMSDELTSPTRQAVNGIEIMQGKQSSNAPILDYWSGFTGGSWQGSFWNAIRDCNIFIENIHNVPDMTVEEKDTWEAEAEFLKAYYHFLLLRTYGPIPILDENIPISASLDAIRVYRNSTDECFEYVINTIDKAIEDLPNRIDNTLYLGRIDRTIAYAIKSRVLLYAASPLFNGNAEYYAGFKGKDGKVLFNTSYDANKWKLAMEAADTAIQVALANSVKLYTYNGTYNSYDDTYVHYDSINAKYFYNYRYILVDKWNSELIWGNSQPETEWWQIQASAMIKSTSASSNEAAWQWLSPSYRMAELYYTKNGLPIDEDLTFDYDNRYDYRKGMSSDLSLFDVQAGQETIKLHFDRELRFYATIAFDRGYNRAHGIKQSIKMRYDEAPGGRSGSSNDYLTTGYALKKYIHPDSQGDSYGNLINYPWPIIRLAELYLNFAEAANEYSGPSQKAYDAINTVRARVGLPKVEEVWADATLARDVNKHISKEGFREIIQQERMIELAFEGHRYHDIRRWKLAENYFNSPILGWNVDENDRDKFYTLSKVQQRVFVSPRDYFQPIKLEELVRNPNLVQNLGW